MKQVTIRRCPTCSAIGGHTDQVKAVFANDPDVRVNVVDGKKGEFNVEVDGKRVTSMTGESLRSVDELAGDIRGPAVAG